MNLATISQRPFWLLLVVLSAAGGWFIGQYARDQSGGKPEGALQTSINSKHDMRRDQSTFPAGSSRDLWMKRVKKAKPGGFLALYEEWSELFPYDDRYDDQYSLNGYHSLCWLMGVWLTVDPESFFDDGLSYGGPAAAQALVELMPEKALELIFPSDGKDPIGYGEIAAVIAEKHPALFLQMNSKGNMFQGREDEVWADAIHELAKSDIQKAAAACLLYEGGDANLFFEAVSGMLREWGNGGQSIEDWVNSIEDPKLKSIAGHAWLSELVEDDPEAALQALYKYNFKEVDFFEPDVPRKVLMHLAKKNPARALKALMEFEDHLSKHPGGDIDPFQEPSAEQKSWAASNPFSQLHISYKEPREELEYNDVRFEIIKVLADEFPDDPSDYISASRALLDEAGVGGDAWRRRLEGFLIREKCNQWTLAECLTAADLWKHESVSSGEDNTLQALAMVAAQDDVHGALASVNRFPESERWFFITEIVKSLPKADEGIRYDLVTTLPTDYWDLQVGSLLGSRADVYASTIADPSSNASNEARRAFSRTWAMKNPEVVAQWVETLQEEAVAEPLVGGLISGWTDFDLDGATAWIDDLPAGTVRQAAAVSMVKEFNWQNNRLAWKYAKLITDPQLKAENYDAIADQWAGAPEAFVSEHSESRRQAGLAPYPFK